MSTADAWVLLQEEGGKLKLYKNDQDWNLAVKKVKSVIATLDEETFVIPV
jgi:hypothetical protein